MDLPALIASLKPEGTYDNWVERLTAAGARVSSAALEHYVARRRRCSDPDIFRAILVVGGRDPEDREGWRLWGEARGMPASVFGEDDPAPVAVP